ncbi:MAG: DUF4252 domain-containing protein [Calditrichaeota bacterium]|nr:MAG: DUF4252 domain-containing protein [Calditrichota bacterium]
MSRYLKVCLLIGFFVAAASIPQSRAQDSKQVENWLFKFYGKETLKPTLHLNLGGWSLGLLKMLDSSIDLKKDSPVDFDQIDWIRVQVYEFQRKPKGKIPAGLQKKFSHAGWNLILRSFSEGSHVVAFLKTEKNSNASVTVFVQDEEELVVIGLGGKIAKDSV